MAENAPNCSVSDTISRKALGCIAQLGDVYDATTDKFCEISMFREQVPPDSLAISVIDNHESEISTSITCSLNEKLDVLGVTPDLKVSVLAGLIELEGAAKYLNEKKTSFKSVECVSVCNVTTVEEKLNITHEYVKNRVCVDALACPRTTHVVVEIKWGANCSIKVTDQNSEDVKKTEVAANLKAQMQKLVGLFALSGDAKEAFTAHEKENWRNFSLKVFGDVLLDSSSESLTTVEGAMEIIRNLPQLIQKSNDGKGKPLTYFMFPLSDPILRNYLGVSHSINQVHRNVDEARIVEVIRVFDDLSEFTQKAHDHFDTMNHHSQCVTASEREEARSILRRLESQEISLRINLEKELEAVRSGKIDSDNLTTFCDKHRTAAHETFQRFKKIMM